MKKWILFLSALIFMNTGFCFSLESLSEKKPHVIFTAALIDNQFEMRKQEYLFSLDYLLKYGATPWIVEACQQSSFFDNLGIPVFYPNVNNPRLRNKGVNEARLLKEALKHFKFSEDELLLKLTGRYFFTSDSFLHLVANNPHADFIVRKTIPLYPNTVFTGCYAAKYKYFKQFIEELNLEKMENEMLNIEDELGRFLKRNPHLEIISVDTLDLTANIFGTGTCDLTHW